MVPMVVEVEDINGNLVATIQKDYFSWPIDNKPPIGINPDTHTEYHPGGRTIL